MLQHIEIGLHEIGSFELGNESRRLVHPTDALIEGQSSTNLLSSVKANTLFAINGTSTVDTDISSLVSTSYLINGNADLNASLELVREFSFSLLGSSEFDPAVGSKIPIAFAINGSSEVLFEILTGHEFHANGQSTFNAYSQTYSDLIFSIKGISKLSIDTYATRNTGFAIHGKGVFTPRNQKVTQTLFDIRSQNNTSFKSQGVQNTLYSILGQSEVTPRLSIVKNTKYALAGGNRTDFITLFKQYRSFLTNIRGTSSTSIRTRLKYIKDLISNIEGTSVWVADFDRKLILPARYSIEGKSSVNLGVNKVRYGVFIVRGSSKVNWERGGNILSFLNPAYDEFIRPYEDRDLEWRE